MMQNRHYEVHLHDAVYEHVQQSNLNQYHVLPDDP